MIKVYKKRAICASLIWFICLPVLVVSILNSESTGNIWVGEINILSVTLWISGLSYLTGFWWYAKSKGYWGVLGVILPFFSAFGLAVLLGIPDRSAQGSQE